MNYLLKTKQTKISKDFDFINMFFANNPHLCKKRISFNQIEFFAGAHKKYFIVNHYRDYNHFIKDILAAWDYEPDVYHYLVQTYDDFFMLQSRAIRSGNFGAIHV